MNHSECWDLLSPSLDGELDSDRAREVAAHVGQCRDCRARLDQMAAISRRIRSLDKLPMPEDVRASLRALAGASREPAVRGWRTLASPWAAASLVAAGLLVVVGIFSLRPEPALVSSDARQEEPAPESADNAAGATDVERKEAPPPAAPPASAGKAAPRRNAPASQAKASDALDETAKRRSRFRNEPQGPVAKHDSAPREPMTAMRRDGFRDLGSTAAKAPPRAMPPAGGAAVENAAVEVEESVDFPAGLYATTLTLSEDAVTFAPLEPRAGERGKEIARDGTGGWTIKTSPAAREDAESVPSAPAAEPNAEAGRQSAALEKPAHGRLPDPLRVLADRRGPGGTVVLLLQVDERGLIYEAVPVGAQTLEPEVAAAVAQLLQGSSLVPYLAQHSVVFPLEVTLPPSEAPR